MSDVDLDLFERLVESKAREWEQSGIRTEFHRGPQRTKSSAWVNCETEWSIAQLVVWTSGEADLSWCAKDTRDAPLVDTYELTSEIGLLGCLDDLTAHLLARP
jgi:hypothetical protein